MRPSHDLDGDVDDTIVSGVGEDDGLQGERGAFSFWPLLGLDWARA